MAEIPLPALPAAPLTEIVEESDFQRLLRKPLKGAAGFERLLDRPVRNALERDAHAEFMRLLERDYNPRSAAPTAVIERFKGLKGSKLDMAGLISSLAFIYVTELAKANRELGRNPEWVNWLLNATDFVSEILTQAEREKAEKESCTCCDKIAELAVIEIRRVEKTVKEGAIKTDDNAKRKLRRAVSRANS